jgi:hypothetical protein
VAALVTAWWAGQWIGINLSGVSAFVQMLGLFERHQPVRESVGFTPTPPTPPTPTPVTTYCPDGQQPAFGRGASSLQQQLGNTMGAPLECEHPTSASGDTAQQTTTGLVAYRAATNTITFTDGWHHWALTATGLVTWEGSRADPPTG